MCFGSFFQNAGSQLCFRFSFLEHFVLSECWHSIVLSSFCFCGKVVACVSVGSHVLLEVCMPPTCLLKSPLSCLAHLKFEERCCEVAIYTSQWLCHNSCSLSSFAGSKFDWEQVFIFRCPCVAKFHNSQFLSSWISCIFLHFFATGFLESKAYGWSARVWASPWAVATAAEVEESVESAVWTHFTFIWLTLWNLCPQQRLLPGSVREMCVFPQKIFFF